MEKGKYFDCTTKTRADQLRFQDYIYPDESTDFESSPIRASWQMNDNSWKTRQCYSKHDIDQLGTHWLIQHGGLRNEADIKKLADGTFKWRMPE